MYRWKVGYIKGKDGTDGPQFIKVQLKDFFFTLQWCESGTHSAENIF
jgi:hypothetical protein